MKNHLLVKLKRVQECFRKSNLKVKTAYVLEKLAKAKIMFANIKNEKKET